MTDEQISRLERFIVSELAKQDTRLGARINETNARLDETSARLDARLDEMNECINETNARLAEGLRENRAQVEQLETYVKGLADGAASASQRATDLAPAIQHEIDRTDRLELRVNVHDRRLDRLEAPGKQPQPTRRRTDKTGGRRK